MDRMSLVELVFKNMETQRAENVKQSGQWTLGQLIKALEPMPADTTVMIDNGGAPVTTSSWRGIYAELAIEYVAFDPGNGPKVADVLAMLRHAVGNTYTGYKGGEFTMHEDTPLWVDQWGQSTDTAVVGVSQETEVVTILTSKIEPYA